MKKAADSAAPCRRPRSAVTRACVPTYPTIPTPAGRVQGHVLVENKPPAIATRTATSGYCTTDADK